MLYIHLDISNKPDLTADLNTSTSHASDSELYSVGIKHVIVDAVCSKNSCLDKCVMPNSKDLGTQGKFVPICHNCGKIGHIRPNCVVLKSHIHWKKQEDSKKGIIEKTSSNKYVPPHRRHISQRGKDFVVCENVNLKFAETFKKHFSKRSQPTCYHCGVSGHIRPHCPQIRLGSGKQSKRQVSLALNLLSLIMFFGNNGIILKGILPHAITVVSMATSKPNASK
jgi:hypothetical protein